MNTIRDINGAEVPLAKVWLVIEGTEDGTCQVLLRDEESHYDIDLPANRVLALLLERFDYRFTPCHVIDPESDKFQRQAMQRGVFS